MKSHLPHVTVLKDTFFIVATDRLTSERQHNMTPDTH